MSADFLSEANDCVTLDEAARRLSAATGKPLTEADILAAALHRHFQLSVFLPPTAAECWSVPDEIPEGYAPDYWADQGQNAVDLSGENIGGVWDVPLVPPALAEVERAYTDLRGLPSLSAPPTTLRPLVQRPGVFCRLRTATLTSPVTSTVSPENQFVIRTAALEQYVVALSAAHSPSSLLDKNLSTKERESYAIIIAALARIAEIDICQPTKAAGIIQTAAITQLSRTISSRNIEGKLTDVVTRLDLKKPPP